MNKQLVDETYRVLTIFECARELTPGDYFVINPYNETFLGIIFLFDILEDFKSKGILDILKSNIEGSEIYGRRGPFNYFGNYVGLIIDFDKLDEYAETFKAKYPRKTHWKNEKKKVDQSEEEPIYEIIYREQVCEIYLGEQLIANPDFNSINEQIFTYIYNHPNRRISIDELEKECLKQRLGRTLNSVVQNLGFTGDIRKVFFNVSKQGIRFKNPIYRKDLEALNIKELKLGNK